MVEKGTPYDEQFRWVRDDAWVLLGKDSQLRCRMIDGSPRRSCPNIAVAQIRRSNGWWAYCAEHLYGRRITKGRVEVKVAADSPAALTGYF